MSTFSRQVLRLAAVAVLPSMASAQLQIAPSPPHMGNECDGEKDGSKCYDDGLLECEGERTVAYNKCKVSEECHHGACREEACKDKADGSHCHADRVVECRAGVTVGVTECLANEDCKADITQLNAASCYDMCQQWVTGSHCRDGHVVECSGGRTVKTSACGLAQKCESSSTGGVRSAECQEHECSGRALGTYCMSGGVLECRDMRAVGWTECPFYQECSGHHGAASCVEDACDGKSDKWHCKGHHRVLCKGSVTAQSETCPDLQECHKIDGLEEPVCQSSAWSSGPPVLLLAALLRWA
mmetsp:Transcript_24891/g.71123  ORF Transcript_24891/g.71123 Transcript_24891/m.71123 type:complete len:299 (+) Transcript_24891:86-982(+)